MKSWTLKTKIRLALFLVSFMPFVLVVVYLQKTGKTRIIDDAVKQYSVQVHQVATGVSMEIKGMKKELRFLASLDMMNDILVGDVDKRIAGLLQHKCRDLGAGVSMYAADMHGNIVAHSSTSPLPKKRMEEMTKHLNRARALQRDTFFMGEKLYIFAPLHASMQKNAPVGNLLLSYDLMRLMRFTPESAEGSFLFYFPDAGLHIGKIQEGMYTLLSALHTPKEAYIGKRFIIVKEQLGSVLSTGWVFEAVKTSYALAFIERFMMFVWLILLAGTVVILLVSWWIGERLLKPVEALSETTRNIIDSRDYTTQVAVGAEDEVGVLSRHFNTLIDTVRETLDSLEEENRHRLERFVQLITIFNALIQTETDEACVTLAVDELDNLMGHAHFRFSSEPLVGTPDEMPLYVTDHAEGVERYYGKIIRMGTPLSDDLNEGRFFRAISSMVTLQLERIELLQQIRSVSESKSVFISYMSHELRTPLHAILGTTQYLIGYESLTSGQQAKIGKIESSASHLLGMINDMLDLAQIEAGKVEVTITHCWAEEIALKVSQAIEMMELLAEQKGIVIKRGTDAVSEGTFCTDEKYLKQIMLNLLSNAVKYTDKGKITVSYSMQERYLAIVVSDTGIGLSEEDMKTVFDAYKQIRNRHHEQGNGLGLAISKKLAKLFGGDLHLESEGRGKGTRAILLLPKCV